MMQPLVDVIIPVHSSTRPIGRAVGSVLEHTAAPVLVTVVAHNIDEGLIREKLGAWARDSRVRVLHLADGIRSPAGPLNLGLAAGEAPFVAVLGSDDEYEAGAVDSWLAMQRRTDAAMVIARIHHVGRGNDAYPPVRPGRERRLDGVKDRLAYRSAPLGLVSRAVFGDLRFTVGLASGEDVAYVTRVWFSGESIAFDRRGPAYIGHHDAADRVSFTARPILEDFLFLDEILGTDWYEALRLSQRRAIGIKLLRTHVFDAIAARLSLWPWPDSERDAFAKALRRILDAAPGVESLLSSIDRRTLDTLLSGSPTSAELELLLGRRWRYQSLPALLPRNPLLALHRQGPFRMLFAGFLTMLPVRRQRRG